MVADDGGMYGVIRWRQMMTTEDGGICGVIRWRQMMAADGVIKWRQMMAADPMRGRKSEKRPSKTKMDIGQAD